MQAPPLTLWPGGLRSPLQHGGPQFPHPSRVEKCEDLLLGAGVLRHSRSSDRVSLIP